jgi:hypothetical protein
MNFVSYCRRTAIVLKLLPSKSGLLVYAINGGIEVEERRPDRARDGVAEWLQRGRYKSTSDAALYPGRCVST